ncbi:hypothetical protein DPMN_129494 [Dreissena polymorpha]|uniref:Uncharacterized protein n=1 Tax=Dreissena polymorpha TaxID=45954 RepID=A0A9D4K0L1_DREPO|nr:hypothetical protein DPMN_129494 [Dreissena polymorpha]
MFFSKAPATNHALSHVHSHGMLAMRTSARDSRPSNRTSGMLAKWLSLMSMVFSRMLNVNKSPLMLLRSAP